MIEKWCSPANTRKTFGNRSGTVERLMHNLPKECVIAGGAVRDLYYGKIAKDIDIWCLEHYSSRVVYERLLAKRPDVFEGHTVEVFERQYEGMHVESVRKVTLACGLVVDIIEAGHGERDGFGVARHFDLNINQFWLNNRMIRSCNPSIQELRQLTVHGKGIENDRDFERVVKFQEKFPEFNWYAFEDMQAQPYKRQLQEARVRKMIEKHRHVIQDGARLAHNPFEHAVVRNEGAIAQAVEVDNREWF